MMSKILGILLLMTFVVMPAYGIVRKDIVEDKLYLDLGEQFESVVKIETETSFGSGVLLNSDTIITSAHTIKHKINIKIIINYTEYTPIKIIYNKDYDIAILKLNKQIKTKNIALYKQNYINNTFIIVGYGYTGVGSKNTRVRDFKKRGAEVRCTALKKCFAECPFIPDDDLGVGGCVSNGDSGGGVFRDEQLAGIITYVTGKGGDGIGDSTYNDSSAFLPINLIEEWIVNNL